MGMIVDHKITQQPSKKFAKNRDGFYPENYGFHPEN